MIINKVRALVVDDSAFMRKALTLMLQSDPEIEVVGSARNGAEAVEMVKKLSPDVVTMDIEMPQMDGLTALRIIMAEKPTPVMMVSSLTSEGASATLEALDLGAIDFIPKETSFVSLNIVHIQTELLAKVKNIARRKSLLMAQAKIRASRGHQTSAPGGKLAAVTQKPGAVKLITPTVKLRHKDLAIVMIGTSTGGPPALQSVITQLPRNFPVPVVVVQHMPAKFTKTLAERLNSLSSVTVKEAEQGDELLAGHVYIAPGGTHMTILKNGSKPQVRIAALPETLYRPSVDVTLQSVIDRYGKRTLGVIMTGMGCDGTQACRNLRTEGGAVIAQSEETCVVYGMPRGVVDAGVADIVAPIELIAHEITSFF